MSLSSVRAFRRHSERQFAITAQFMPPHDPAEVEAFVADMSRFEGMGILEMQDAVGDRPLPTGFIHIRTYDAITREETGYSLGSLTRPATARNLVYLADPVNSGRDKSDAWIKTTAMPVTTPGVLDLAIHYHYTKKGDETRCPAAAAAPSPSRRRRRA